MSTIKQISVLQSDNTYINKDIGVDANNVDIDENNTLADKIRSWNNKVDKVSGKSLSTEDYTTEEKTKLAGLSNYDDTILAGKIADIEEIIPSTVTISNKLATISDIEEIDLMSDWDFKSSLIDRINNYAVTLNGQATIDANGVAFNSSASSIVIPNQLLMSDTIYEIKIGAMQKQFPNTVHGRLFVYLPSSYSGSSTSNNTGFIYHYQTQRWGVWDSVNKWQDSDISEADYFENSTLKIKIDDLGKWHIYKDNILIFEPSEALPIEALSLSIGSQEDTFYNIVIENLKIIHGGSSVPTAHASSETTYGVGSSTEYGHVKVVNAVETRITDQAAAASAQSVYDLLKIIAPVFSELVDYSAGDLCIYQGELYKCIIDHSAGAWDDNHFGVTNLVNEIYISRNE